MLQRPVPDDAPRIVARGEREDEGGTMIIDIKDLLATKEGRLIAETFPKLTLDRQKAVAKLVASIAALPAVKPPARPRGQQIGFTTDRKKKR